MVRLLVFAALAILLIACSGSSGQTASSPSEPSTQSTRAPTPSGPTARVEPRSGPPGSEITVSGASWPPGVLIDVTGRLPAGVSADPFTTATTDESGGFSVTFRLERTPDGNDLEVGGYILIAQYQNIQVGVPFLVETRRPIQNSGPG